MDWSTLTGPAAAAAIPTGGDSMQFLRWIPWDLVGVPSSNQRRPGQQDAIPFGPGLDAQSWIPGDLVGFPSSDPRGPVLDSQSWIHAPA